MDRPVIHALITVRSATLRHRMPTLDDNRQFATDVVRKLAAAGHKSLWAGGCVRDFMLNRTPGDFDVATTARPDQVRKIFGHKRTLAVGANFGVIVVLGPKSVSPVEVATFRTEGPYLDGRRPESVEFCTPEEDAQRRDFTINGMFFDPLKEQVHDFVGGMQDLQAGVLRAIGDPAARFDEDKLRMLRAVRFTATLGFRLDSETAVAVERHAESIKVVSAERIAQELRRMLSHHNRGQAVRLMRDVNLLQQVLPEVMQLWSDQKTAETTLAAVSHLEDAASFESAAATLMHQLVDIGDDHKQRTRTLNEICHRLRLSNDETNRIVWLVHNLREIAGLSSASQARIKRLLCQPGAAELLGVSRAVALSKEESTDDVDFAAKFLASHSEDELKPAPIVTGGTLREWGMTPGPKFKVILDDMYDRQLNGEIHDLAEAKTVFDSVDVGD